MKIAETVATRSNCLIYKAGCVLVKNRQIMATGFNGRPSGLEHCHPEDSDSWNEQCDFCLHGDEIVNLFSYAASIGIDFSHSDLYLGRNDYGGEGGFLYQDIALVMLVNAGVDRVFVKQGFKIFDFWEEQLEQLPIEIIEVSNEEENLDNKEGEETR
jgi:dCMP deaminase